MGRWAHTPEIVGSIPTPATNVLEGGEKNMGFFSGLIIGALGVLVIAYLVYQNNKKKIKKAIAILEGPGTAEEKIKQNKELFF